MKHCFLVNCHADMPQWLRLARILREVFPESGLVGYFDGPECLSSETAEARALCDHRMRMGHEPDKAKSLVAALSAATFEAYYVGKYTHASFLHADMVPTDREQFLRFLKRFADSGKALTFAPMWPAHKFLDFCNLHFNLPLAFAQGLFPIPFKEPPPKHRSNEAVVTYRWDEVRPGWKDEAYHLWTSVWPICGYRPAGGEPVIKWGHLHGAQFEVHNFTPETSVIHTNSGWFWENAREVCRWK